MINQGGDGQKVDTRGQAGALALGLGRDPHHVPIPGYCDTIVFYPLKFITFSEFLTYARDPGIVVVDLDQNRQGDGSVPIHEVFLLIRGPHLEIRRKLAVAVPLQNCESSNLRSKYS